MGVGVMGVGVDKNSLWPKVSCKEYPDETVDSIVTSPRSHGLIGCPLFLLSLKLETVVFSLSALFLLTE